MILLLASIGASYAAQYVMTGLCTGDVAFLRHPSASAAMAEAAARAPVPPSLPTEQPPEEVLDRGKVLDGRLTLLASLGRRRRKGARPARTSHGRTPTMSEGNEVRM
jgi:hypothetical protein